MSESPYYLNCVNVKGPEGHKPPGFIQHRADVVSLIFRRALELVPDPTACSDREFYEVICRAESDMEASEPLTGGVMLTLAAICLLTLERHSLRLGAVGQKADA